MSSRFSRPRFVATSEEEKPKPKPKATKGAAPADDNARWRIPEWFPGLSEGKIAQLKTFHGELLKFNARVNLIGRSTERESDELHFADCIYASDIILHEKLPLRVFDIGSGNGFPGLVLGILDSKRDFVLVEIDNRKSEFLKHVIHLLGLKRTSVMNARVESLVDVGVEAAVTRGFAAISKTLLSCNRIFPKGGQFFHLKGNNWSSEIAALPSQLISVWHPELRGEYTLPVCQARRAIVATQKIK